MIKGRRAIAMVSVLVASTALLRAQTPAEAPRLGGEEAVATPATMAPVQELAKVYGAMCAGCHGDNQQGGRGPALDAALLSQRSDDQLHATLANGIPSGGMPGFKGAVPDADLWKMVNLLRLRGSNANAPRIEALQPAGQVIRTAKQSFRLDPIVSGLDTPWAIAFLPNGGMLVTERPGRLRIVDKNGRLLPEAVSGLPAPWVRQDGGYFDVAVDPDYKRNGWVYLSYSEVLPGHVVTAAEAATPGPGVTRVDPPSNTVMIRGKIDRANHWTQNQILFRGAPQLYTRDGSHYGSRFLFDGKGHLFYSLGERGAMANAQRLDTPLGKIHRIMTDGRVPADNPFVKTPGAVPTIWSYGHRNPEGLIWNPVTGDLWETEHGPVGGDEVNVVQKGHNYGWGVVSMGLQSGISLREAPGMDAPLAYYTPTIAPSGITFYTGNRYPGWKNNLFVGGLAGQQLRRLVTDGRRITDQEILFQRYGRVRDVVQGPDGYLYVAIERAPGPRTAQSVAAPPVGWIVRLTPVSDTPG